MSFDLLKQNIVLNKNNVALASLTFEHLEELTEICKSGNFGKIRTTSTPHFTEVNLYIEKALNQKEKGIRYPFAVLENSSQKLIGTTSYHDILYTAKRLEIGNTWYKPEFQRTHVNTTCKYLLFNYAFEILKANTVGLRADIFNFKSQKAIERLGIQKDGVIRGNAVRKDGTIRDTVMYSVVAGEWENIKAHLEYLLDSY
ncbi:GNAT family N-acetyltransferase [Acinetobacter calcoaceticus]